MKRDLEQDSGGMAPCGLTRRRGATLEQAIYEAVVDQLSSVGYGALTMEGVAACAHTGKASLYRRWPSKEDLVVEAVQHLVPALDDPPDTGSIRGDVLDLLGRMARMANSPTGCAIQNLLGSVQGHRDLLKAVHARVIEPRRQMMLAAIERGVLRGEVRPGAAKPLVAQVGPAMIVHHLMMEGPPVRPALVESIVDDVVLPMLRRDAKAPLAAVE